MNIDETVDRPVGIGASDDRQDREQHDVRQPIQLALGPPWVFDSASKVTNGVNDAMATHPRLWRLPARKSDEPRRRNPLCRYPRAVGIGV